MVWFSIHIDQEFGMKTFNINLILDPFRDIPRKNISIQIRWIHDGTMNGTSRFYCVHFPALRNNLYWCYVIIKELKELLLSAPAQYSFLSDLQSYSQLPVIISSRQAASLFNILHHKFRVWIFHPFLNQPNWVFL